MLSSSSIKWLVILNPVAGNGAVAKRWPTIEEHFRVGGLDFEVLQTTARTHASQLTMTGIQNGVRYILAVGGDGTNNEVINGILLQKVVPPSAITYALLPIGTGNDWQRTYRLPKDIPSFLSMLLAQRTRMQDIGEVSYFKEGKQKRHFFTNVAGMAYDAFVVRVIEQESFTVHNKLLYLYMIIRCLWKYRLTKAKVEWEGKVAEDHYYTINVGICSYSGGGMQLVPHAIADDGLLAVTLAGPMSKLEVLLNTYRFYNGSVAEHSKVQTFQTRQLKVVPLTDQPIYLEVDGEFLGEAPVEFTIHEKVLKVVVP